MKRNIEKETETQIEKYLLEFAGGFVIQVPNYHTNSLNKFIRAYLSNYFNALIRGRLMLVKKVGSSFSGVWSSFRGRHALFVFKLH